MNQQKLLIITLKSCFTLIEMLKYLSITLEVDFMDINTFKMKKKLTFSIRQIIKEKSNS
jgi:hypothetical protein